MLSCAQTIDLKEKNENNFIVAAHDLQTLAAVPRIKSSPRREAITLKEK